MGAVLRQGTFIDKMAKLGWTAGDRFEEPNDPRPLVRCIARYHAFLYLMERSADMFFVPTLVSASPRVLVRDVVLITSQDIVRVPRDPDMQLLTKGAPGPSLAHAPT